MTGSHDILVLLFQNIYKWKRRKKVIKMPLGGDVQDWFKSLPFFTRYWFGGTVLFTLLGRFGLLPASWLFLFWEPLWYKFQIWRPVTAIFYYPLSPQTGFHFLINLYFMYNYSLRLEFTCLCVLLISTGRTVNDVFCIKN